MLKDRVIVCYTSGTWEFPWGISQRIMEKLSMFNTVIYIECQPSFLHGHVQGLSYLKSYGKKKSGFNKINDNLLIYTPKAGLPFNNYVRGFNVINQRRIREDIKREINRYDSEKAILWVFAPCAIDFVKTVGKYFTIYHCAANFSDEKGNFLRKRTVSNMEDELARRSDIVVAQTRTLCGRFKTFGKQTFYLPSAVDFGNDENGIFTAREIDKTKHPRIGIVGYFNDDFYDAELLAYLVDSKPEWTFIFVGLVTEKAYKFKKLGKRSNAVFLGYKHPKEIRGYVKKMDVGIIPYKVNDFMKEVSPIKLYEYLACGIPVVTTKLPDLENYGGTIKIANEKNEFLAHIESFLKDERKEAIQKRAFELAKENSLEKYVESLSEVIEGMQSA